MKIRNLELVASHKLLYAGLFPDNRFIDIFEETFILPLVYA